MIKLNINSDAVVRFTAKLERMHRSALPVAVRNTLSKTAFDVKKETMPDSAKKNFIHRAPNFFKANSKVVPATGFNLSSMKATVGFTPKTGTDKSVDDLEQQEEGGTIGGRAFIPLKRARTGSSWNKRVKANARISQIKGSIIDATDAGPKNARNKNQKFTKSAAHACKGGWILGNNSKGGNKILFLIKSIKRVKGNTVIKADPMFAVQKGRKVNPKATHFMQDASEKSAKKMEQTFVQEAKKQIDRLK